MNTIQKEEFSSLLITLMSVKLLLSYPVTIVKNSGNAAWLQIIYITLLALFLFFVTAKVYEKKINLIELCKIHTNKPLKIIVGLLVFMILLMNAVSITRIFPESIKIVLLQDNDTDIILGVFALVIFLGARYGIESIVRINYIFLPICGILIFAFILLLIPNYKPENLFPIFGTGAKRIFINGISGLSIFSDIIILNIFLVYAKNLKSAKQSAYRAILISGGVGLIFVVMYTMIYPYPVSSDFILPVYQMSKVISLGSFFNRFEAVFQFVWSILLFLYGSAYLYTMCFVLQITFGLKYLKPLLFPVVLLTATLAIMPDSFMSAYGQSNIFEYIVFPLVFFLPIIIGVLDKVKSKKESYIGKD